MFSLKIETILLITLDRQDLVSIREWSATGITTHIQACMETQLHVHTQTTLYI